jgi:flavin reductase (DIM6/NTAB) family NADH-FMN oxidoreductase RutF
VLVSSENEDGTTNVAAMSSAFWLGHNCVLGFGAGSKTPLNIIRTKQCVLNLPDDTMTAPVNALASTTGTEYPSAAKISRGYRYVKDKWTCANLTPEVSDFITPSRIKECPVQMECELTGTHPLMDNVPDRRGSLVAIEVKILRIHVKDHLRMDGYANRIDPDKWKPMIMSFQQLYGLREGQITESVLGKIDEEKYRALTKSEVVTSPGDNDQQISEESHRN